MTEIPYSINIEDCSMVVDYGSSPIRISLVSYYTATALNVHFSIWMQ